MTLFVLRADVAGADGSVGRVVEELGGIVFEIRANAIGKESG